LLQESPVLESGPVFLLSLLGLKLETPKGLAERACQQGNSRRSRTAGYTNDFYLIREN
jgi:hypothetical protein